MSRDRERVRSKEKSWMGEREGERIPIFPSRLRRRVPYHFDDFSGRERGDSVWLNEWQLAKGRFYCSQTSQTHLFVKRFIILPPFFTTFDRHEPKESYFYIHNFIWISCTLYFRKNRVNRNGFPCPDLFAHFRRHNSARRNKYRRGFVRLRRGCCVETLGETVFARNSLTISKGRRRERIEHEQQTFWTITLADWK